MHKARSLSIEARDSYSKLAAKFAKLKENNSNLKRRHSKQELKAYEDCAFIIRQVEQLEDSKKASRHEKDRRKQL